MSSQPRGGRKALLVAAVALLSLAVVEVASRVLEQVADRARATRTERENPFIEATHVVPVFERDASGRSYVRTRHHWISRTQRFAASKSKRGFRVFCLGGSAAAGWPHEERDSYPALLARMLEAVLPGREIEVVNAAGHTYASYRVKVVFDEIIDYEPDVIAIYSGNNEFLERVVYRPRSLAGSSSGSVFSKLATVRLVRRIVNASTFTGPVFDVENYGQRDQIATRLSFAFGRSSALRDDPAQFTAVRAHYRFNLERMLEEAERRGIPVVLFTVPVNLEDWRPNVSRHADGFGDAAVEAEWRPAFRTGVEALESRRFELARAAMERAVAFDRDYAESWFHLGTAQLAVGRREEAQISFYEALERDAYPFRSVFNDVVHEVAMGRGMKPLDVVALFEREADDGIPGFDLFVDYVHPTVAANELIAHGLLQTLIERKLLPHPSVAAADAVRIEIDPEVEEQVAPLRGLYGQFLVMRQYESLDALAERLRAAIDREMPGASAHRRLRLKRVRDDLDTMQSVVAPYRRLLRAEKLGILEREFDAEEADSVFDRYAALIHAMEARDLSQAEFRTFLPERSGGAPRHKAVREASSAANASAAPAAPDACQPLSLRRPATRSNVVLIVGDTWRRDRTGAYGGPAATRAFDAFASSNLLFTNAFSQAPWTKPSIATLFTSLYPSQHRVASDPALRNPQKPEVAPTVRADVLQDSLTTLAEVLSAAGYETAAFVANPWLKGRFGFAQGFEMYDDSFARFENPARDLSRRALDWLDARKDERPLFLYLHYMGAHQPYPALTRGDIEGLAEEAPVPDPAPRHVQKMIRSILRVRGVESRELARKVKSRALVKRAYDRGVASFDLELGVFLDGFEGRPEQVGSAILVTSDHGEALFERDFGNHGKSLFDEEIAIPFAARLPAASGGGEVVDCSVGLVDVMPTLCTYLGVDCPTPVFGNSFVGLEGDGDRASERSGHYAVSEGVMGRPGLRSIRNRRFKLTWELQAEDSKTQPFRVLIDIQADPDEKRNLLAQAYRKDETSDVRRNLIDAMKEAVPEYAVPVPETRPLAAEEIQRLKELGYVEE